MEKEKKINTIKFITCQKCGEAKQTNKICNNCYDFGMVAWTGKTLLYWDKRINYFQISLDDTKKFVKNVINLGLALFGLLGALMLGWVIYSFSLTALPIWQFFSIKSWQLFIFWLSMSTNSYLYYRFQRDAEKIKYIPKKKYQEDLVAEKNLTIENIDTLTEKDKISIKNYFTEQAHQAIVGSWKSAKRYKNSKITPVHLLISLLTFEKTQIIFSRLGINFDALKTKIGRLLSIEPRREKILHIDMNNQVKEIIFNSYFLAYQLKQKKVEITEILEALLEQDNSVKEMLYDLDITLDKIKNVIAWLRIRGLLKDNLQKFRRRASLKPGSNMDRAMTAIATPILDRFSQDLTLLAKHGYLMPCVGREKEIEEIFVIMSGGTRRSVILVGNPGVGKKTIVEGIAQRMVEEDVPKFLQDKRLVSLNVAQLVSGVNASEAQERMIYILSEIRRSGNIILVVNDIHGLIGISSGRQGSIDLADVLSQALENNSVLCISATTPSDYNKYIEGKNSLSNVLEKLNVEEVSGNEAIQILESKVGAIEYHNKIYFSYDSIAKTVELSDRYLHDRYLPEKAIEILQQTATTVSNQKGPNSIITVNDVASIISEKTNIPLTEITQEESEKLINLEEKIHERVVGQNEAVDMVASSLRRARAEMRDKKRPIVNLLFLGPTGVGKTELAKTIAEVYFGAENIMIRLDMSEYQEKSSINRLIGAPPGYSQAGEGGYFTEAVRKNPFSLILLDEIEKAHPDILNIFLQVMDDGRLTDTSGRTVDFTSAIIIATSNAATGFIQSEVKKKTPLIEIKKQLIEQHLEKYFRPEFLNRFDGIIVFKPLDVPDIESITKLMLVNIKKKLEADKGIILKATPEAIIDLANAGFSPEFGARPLRRVIQNQIQDPITNFILSNRLSRRDTIIVKSKGQIEIKKAKKI